MVLDVLLRRDMILGPAFEGDNHVTTYACHYSFGPLAFSATDDLGPISFEQFEIGPKVESNQKVCYFGESKWSKTGTACICRHVITSFKCFFGPKMIQS